MTVDKDYKIAVYTIAKNEDQFVHRWYESAKNADYLLIVDTGSTDKTIEYALDLGINVESITVEPWRFDSARNQALDYLPQDIDYCIALDMDEVLVGDWRKSFQSISPNVFLNSNSVVTTRPRYKYIWSWNPDGTPGLVYGGDKIHTRHNYIWKHPVHEVLVSTATEVQQWIDLEIHHYPDLTKSRGQYLPLLELSVKEDPTSDRNSFYYARELYFNNFYDTAAQEFKRHLSLPNAQWLPERAASMRYLSKIEPYNKEVWLLRAAAEAPERREAWVELAQLYYEKNQWPSCYASAKRALSITQKPLEYLCEEFAWGSLPYDLAALSAYFLGLKKDAVELGEQAVLLNPNDRRLQINLQFYKKDNNQ